MIVNVLVIVATKPNLGGLTSELRAFTKPTSTLRHLCLFKPLRSTVELAGVAGQLVLHCTDEAQLGRNSCLQFARLAPFF